MQPSNTSAKIAHGTTIIATGRKAMLAPTTVVPVGVRSTSSWSDYVGQTIHI